VRSRALGTLAAALAVGGAVLGVALSRTQPARSVPTATPQSAPRVPIPAAPKPHAPFAVGLRVLRLVDHSRFLGGEPRTLATVVRYPALGAVSATDVPDAQPAQAGGPFPLIVFAHGYRLAPYTYTGLLRAWAHAGYVVAAPVFPRTSAEASVLDRSDLINQPQDVRFVIARLLAQRGGPLGGLIDGTRIVVGGHSDGADTALAVAYGKPADRRVRAALGFAGAEIAAFTGFGRRPRRVPLLAVQGTADPVNAPSSTYSYFAGAPRPKYLLRLLGAGHTAPYQDEQPQLGVVARVSSAFLDGYVKGDAPAVRALRALGSVHGRSTLQVDK
jgi:predicted dienelactone hydrolase